MINIETAKEILLNYLDKCEKSTTYNNSPINMNAFIFSEAHGKSYNIATATAYIARYAATEGAKAENTEDLLKAMHFLLFEIQRKEGIVVEVDGDDVLYKESISDKYWIQYSYIGRDCLLILHKKIDCFVENEIDRIFIYNANKEVILHKAMEAIDKYEHPF